MAENAPPRANHEDRRRHAHDFNFINHVTAWAAILAALSAAFAAYFSSKQASIATDQEVRQLRSYVGIATGQDVNKIPYNRLEFVDAGSGPQPHTGWIGARNDGQTPALNYDDRITIGLFPLPLPVDFDFRASKEYSVPIMNPHSDFYDSITASANPVTSPAPEIGKTHAEYVFGTISYDDVFGNHHYTNYCLFYIGINDPGSYCAKHNDSDDSNRVARTP